MITLTCSFFQQCIVFCVLLVHGWTKIFYIYYNYYIIYYIILYSTRDIIWHNYFFTTLDQ